MANFKRNHYVPQWYQKRFLLPENGLFKFHYLDLKPEKIKINKGRFFTRDNMLRWGPAKCFMEKDLYTTRFGNIESTEIEEKFFGQIDSDGKHAVEYFSEFEHPSVHYGAFKAMMEYMAAQRIRTPKGLAYLSKVAKTQTKNDLLYKMQQLYQMFCAIWTESIWIIANADNSSTKFLLSDQPVTVYNRAFFPQSALCRQDGDPPVWLDGTHTIFPLSKDKLLLLTNLSWARNPFGNPAKERPNAELFRPAIFKFQDIQIRRDLEEEEVLKINLIIKGRAHRYLAACEENWLFPERRLPKLRWDKVGENHLLMPDPRSMSFATEMHFGMKSGNHYSVDEYGRRPGQDGYNSERRRDLEWISFHAFQGEYARIHGPVRRGRSYCYSFLSPEEDDYDSHRGFLKLESRYKRTLRECRTIRKKKRKRS